MGKFKVGDRVKRTKPSEWSWQFGELGKEYTVLDVPHETSIVVIEGQPGATSSCFELVAPAWAPKVGDRVVVTYGYGWNGEAIVKNAGTPTNILVTMAGVIFANEDGGFHVKHLQPLPTLTIEAGRYYKTRDGRKVGPMYEYDSDPCFGSSELFAGGLWHTDGSAWFRDASDSPNLIALWEEPAATAAVVSTTGAQVDALAEEYGPAPYVDPSAMIAQALGSNDNEPPASQEAERKLIKTKSGYGFEIARVGNYAWIDIGQKAPITVNISGITDAA